MKIETKFSIGDSVWVMKDDKPQRFPIFFINVSASGSMNAPVGTKPVYATVRYSSADGEFDIPESACYATKEELLASLCPLQPLNISDMTQDQFAKYAYRHSEVIIFHQKHPEIDVECMLLAVDFDCGTFKLAPFDTELYEDESFYASYEYCDKPRKGRELKVIVNGRTKKIKLPDTLWRPQ